MIRVAGYCRVSTDKEDQINSFASQKRYFQEYIARNAEWELSDIYADEGVSGTSTRKRVQFQRMMDDAYNKRFQLIITKEVSRFSRNLLDTIAYTRELKALGIGVIFLTDGFCTLDPDAELRLSIMGSLAQEESRKTSARVKWGQTRQMERGIVFGTTMLGYDLSHGKLTVNPEGAEIVRLIFYKYGIEKKGTALIARELSEAGCRTLNGNREWSESTILKILKNEKYAGDLVQKKTITPDFLTHTRKVNNGEEPVISISDHHEAIIPRDFWNLVQEEISSRSRSLNSTTARSSRFLFSGKIICAECGAHFVSRTKTRKDSSSYRRWGCYTASRYGKIAPDNSRGCNVGKQIRDDLLLEMLRYVIRNLKIDHSTIIEQVTAITIHSAKSAGVFPQNPAKLKQKLQLLQKKRTAAVDSFLSGTLSKADFLMIQSYYDSAARDLAQKITEMEQRSEAAPECFVQKIKDACGEILSGNESTETFLRMILEYVRVHADGIVEIKLNQLNIIWKFQLKKGKATHI